MPYFAICAGLLGLIYAGLSFNVGRVRGQKKIWLGDGGDKDLLTAMRAQANFNEYVPLCLILIFMTSWQHGLRTVMGLSILLVVARILHAGGMLGAIPRGRMLGAFGTMAVLLVSSVLVALAGLGVKLY